MLSLIQKVPSLPLLLRIKYCQFIVLLWYQLILFYQITYSSCLIFYISHPVLMLRQKYVLVFLSIIQICNDIYSIILEFVSDMYVSTVGFIIISYNEGSSRKISPR